MARITARFKSNLAGKRKLATFTFGVFRSARKPFADHLLIMVLL